LKTDQAHSGHLAKEGLFFTPARTFAPHFSCHVLSSPEPSQTLVKQQHGRGVEVWCNQLKLEVDRKGHSKPKITDFAAETLLTHLERRI
jgi:hypothetical protein